MSLDAVEAVRPTPPSIDPPEPAPVQRVPTLPLRRITSDDRESLARLAARIGEIREFWDDRFRVSSQAAVQAFARTFAHPTRSLTFDVCDDAGVLCFAEIEPGWRAQVYAYSWHRRANLADADDQLWRTAAQIAMQAYDLLVLDAFVLSDNRLSRRAVTRRGFRFRGYVPNAAWYDGVSHDVAWYEADREAVGLPRPEE